MVSGLGCPAVRGEGSSREEEPRDGRGSLVRWEGLLVPGGEGLERRELIRSSSQLREIFEKGKVLKGRYLTLFYKRSEERKAGFVLKRDLKGAVKRNKLKRRLRDIYRKEKRRIDPQVEIVLLTGKRAEKVDYYDLREDLLQTLSRAEILRNG